MTEPKRYGIGEMADGSVNIFNSVEEAREALAEAEALVDAAFEPDDLSDLDEVVKLLGKAKPRQP